MLRIAYTALVIFFNTLFMLLKEKKNLTPSNKILAPPLIMWIIYKKKKKNTLGARSPNNEYFKGVKCNFSKQLIVHKRKSHANFQYTYDGMYGKKICMKSVTCIDFTIVYFNDA
jgi:hypothetical protein